MRKNKIREAVVHGVAALMFLLLPLAFAPGTPGTAGFLHDPHLRRNLLSSLLMLVYFYANYFWFIPQFYFKKKYLLFALPGVLFLFSVALLPPSLFPFDGRGPGGSPPSGTVGLGHILFETGHQFFFFAATLLLSLTLRINDRWRRTEKEKLDTELSYLRAQINPHFLFNTLNGIYSLAIEKSDKTADAVVKLSGMMRYVLSEAHNEYVSLERELAYIDDYIELQRMRLGDTVFLTHTSAGHVANRQIAPLVLIPFVENAFKHGVNPEKNAHITVHTQTEGDSFTLEVFNNKMDRIPEPAEKSGLGIENTRNRLRLFYPGRHELIIRDGEKTFTVVLKIRLTE